jgi:hypothetical protein
VQFYEEKEKDKKILRRAEVFCPTQHFCGKSILFDFLLIAVVITAAAGIKMQ